MSILINSYNYILLSDIKIPNQGVNLSDIIFYDYHEPHRFIYNSELEEYLYDLLHPYIILKKYKFLLYDKVECDDISSNKRLNRFIAWSKKINIYDDLVISNSYSNLKCDFNFKYLPWFLGWSSIDNLEFNQRTLDKRFLFLNTRPRKHRRIFYDFFKDNNLLEKTYWTFGSNEKYNPYVWDSTKYPIKNFNNNEEIPIVDMHKLIPQHIDSFISIVTETYFFYEDEIDTPWDSGIQDVPTFVTEKTEKCFSALHPFIIISTPYFLKHLKELGFKTFDKWWDESYDNEENDNTRIEKIKLLIMEISKWDNYKCISVFNEMREVLEWNQKVNTEHELINKTMICIK